MNKKIIKESSIDIRPEEKSADLMNLTVQTEEGTDRDKMTEFKPHQRSTTTLTLTILSIILSIMLLACLGFLFVSTAQSSSEIGRLRSQLTTTTWSLGNATDQLSDRQKLLTQLGEKTRQFSEAETLLEAVSEQKKSQAQN
jgi:hypothetical protein